MGVASLVAAPALVEAFGRKPNVLPEAKTPIIQQTEYGKWLDERELIALTESREMALARIEKSIGKRRFQEIVAHATRCVEKVESVVKR